MSLYLTSKDYKIILLFLLLVPVSTLAVFGGVAGDNLSVLNDVLVVIGLVAVLYGMNSGRKRWRGELGRYLNLLSIGVSIIVVSEIIELLLSDFLTPGSLLGVTLETWSRVVEMGTIAGIFITAYAFYRFSNGPWFHRRGGVDSRMAERETR